MKEGNLIHKVFLSLLTALLALSLIGCLPSFDAEAEQDFYQGIEHRRQGNNDVAIEEFTRAIELDSDYYFAYYNRALVHYHSGELESSLVDYNKAIELQPDNLYWTFERGFLYIELGYREKAIIHFFDDGFLHFSEIVKTAKYSPQLTKDFNNHGEIKSNG